MKEKINHFLCEYLAAILFLLFVIFFVVPMIICGFYDEYGGKINTVQTIEDSAEISLEKDVKQYRRVFNTTYNYNVIVNYNGLVLKVNDENLYRVLDGVTTVAITIDKQSLNNGDEKYVLRTINGRQVPEDKQIGGKISNE